MYSPFPEGIFANSMQQSIQRHDFVMKYFGKYNLPTLYADMQLSIHRVVCIDYVFIFIIYMYLSLKIDRGY